ncbi:NAD(P)-dependent oxidoreductase [Catenulispora yoronensis]|uniref:NAD(P)-dependent oxidoreductase n=1 Tax=Catenulispora yoronensis TaxID=450799 RepID=A0ABP5F8Z2_9ACTN
MTRTTRWSRVLVTGAAGGIGQAAVPYLRQRGFTVTALVLPADSDPPPADRTVVGDAADVDTVADALTGCDAVVHLAALAHPSLGTPYEVYRNNVASTFNVLSQAGEASIHRAVIASSIHAPGYGLNPHTPLPAYFPLDEDLPYDIADPYSLSKRSDELTAQMASRTWGMQVVALRFPLVKTLPVLRQEKRVAEADPKSMVRTGWAYLTMTDAVRAIEAALRAPLVGAHVIGLSAADTLLDRPTRRLLDEYAPDVPRRRPFDGNAPLIDTTLAEHLLRFTPSESVHEDTGWGRRP